MNEEHIRQYIRQTYYLSHGFARGPMVSSIVAFFITLASSLFCVLLDKQYGYGFWGGIVLFFFSLLVLLNIFLYIAHHGSRQLTIFGLLGCSTLASISVFSLEFAFLFLSFVDQAPTIWWLIVLLVPFPFLLINVLRMQMMVARGRVRKKNKGSNLATLLYRLILVFSFFALVVVHAFLRASSPFIAIYFYAGYSLLTACFLVWQSSEYGVIAYCAKKYIITDWLLHPEDDEIPWALRKDDDDKNLPPQSRL